MRCSQTDGDKGNRAFWRKTKRSAAARARTPPLHTSSRCCRTMPLVWRQLIAIAAQNDTTTTHTHRVAWACWRPDRARNAASLIRGGFLARPRSNANDTVPSQGLPKPPQLTHESMHGTNPLTSARAIRSSGRVRARERSRLGSGVGVDLASGSGLGWLGVRVRV